MLLAVRNFCLAGLLVLCAWWWWPPGALRHPPGVRVRGDPAQTALPPSPLCQIHGYDLTALATYDLNARVLHTRRYRDDAGDLVPYDVALGWGAMSDQAVLDQLEISQSNRFFFYEWRGQPPLPPAEIISHAANHHIIAANSVVAAAVRRLRRGQFVQMRGCLVNVTRRNGFHWNTSLTRTDTGRGACEVFYVESIAVSDEPA